MSPSCLQSRRIFDEYSRQIRTAKYSFTVNSYMFLGISVCIFEAESCSWGLIFEVRLGLANFVSTWIMFAFSLRFKEDSCNILLTRLWWLILSILNAMEGKCHENPKKNLFENQKKKWQPLIIGQSYMRHWCDCLKGVWYSSSSLEWMKLTIHVFFVILWHEILSIVMRIGHNI